MRSAGLGRVEERERKVRRMTRGGRRRRSGSLGMVGSFMVVVLCDLLHGSVMGFIFLE